MKHPLLLLEDLGDEAKLIYFISSLDRKLGAGRRFCHIFLLGFGLNYQFPLYHIQGGGLVEAFYRLRDHTRIVTRWDRKSFKTNCITTRLANPQIN